MVVAARKGGAEREQLLDALAALRAVRDELSAWEPELISAARSNGTSWAALAPALGVASCATNRRPPGRAGHPASGEVPCARVPISEEPDQPQV
ncbi:hypothetical protein [Amycolatopsis acidiphila]|uniref:hypothetical protein n=1 Tax=Amycolatopsis acidiphila TaxID=715473 RepID=UPI00198BF7FD|nr:hypothetical protein GCM10017788_59520 [Amycolatopsis acidiphila]